MYLQARSKISQTVKSFTYANQVFSEFKKLGLKPDKEMFFGVFNACAVLGDMKEGLLHFESMRKCYDIVPSMDHYKSVVDMLGSSGYLNEALEFIEKMPLEPSVEIWETMMLNCWVHGDIELGERCAEIIEALDPSHLDEQVKAGFIPSKLHEFRVGDTSHPDHVKLFNQLRCLKGPMKEVGYVPHLKCVLRDIDQKSKEGALPPYSEILALSQALLTSPPRAPIRIIKNLRICIDCHDALKIVSKLAGRLIVVRANTRFHHFEDGVCSCGDLW